MEKLFVTGMGRSGTTLLDKLLANHPEMDVLSQPLPLFFVDVKRRFLSEKGVDKYFVLNDDLVNRGYSQGEFNTFLTKLETNTSDVISIFEKMKNYSGQSTKIDFPVTSPSPPVHGFSDLIDKCLESFKIDISCRFLGTKEIMCEEFLPYLCDNGYKCILIVRDPRDVLASANYPKGEKYIGTKKPTLFILRNWRKSVEYAYQLKDSENFHLLRYEDLVKNPVGTLNLITNFLGVSAYRQDHFRDGVRDRNGELWQANSSFGVQDSFISRRPEKMYTNTLSTEEIAYTEAVCSLELEWMGYPLPAQQPSAKTIRDFEDHGVADDENLPACFSSDTSNVNKEISRLNDFRGFYQS